jgi:glutaminyl-tRNA synthetase
MTTSSTAEAPTSNFLRHIVERDLAEGRYAGRRFAGVPGDAASLAGAPVDTAAIRTRFPPEPNGYLHVGHAKSITLNFGLAEEYGGACHLRFDDTNPEKEEQEYVDAIEDAVRWLGYDRGPHLYFASSYFDVMYRAAEALVGAGLAYVDEQTAEEMRSNRGDFQTPGTASPFRDRTPDENLVRLRQMKAGELADGAAVLRAKIDLASPNINLRDPTLYRIKRATHHATGDTWCIYPMYTYAHPIEDALERITHSVCTLEFEDQRPFYDWLLDHLVALGVVATPRPHQHEFARLNLTYVITSKRRLRQLVEERIVDGWDDPRMPTLAGMRRRGYTPESIRLMCERAGTSKSGGWTEYASLEAALREDLDPKAPGRWRCSIRSGSSSSTGRRSSAAPGTASAARHPSIRTMQRAASAASSSDPRSGSSATTTRPRRRRASSGSFPATACACATGSSSSASERSTARFERRSCPTRAAARPAPTRSR